MSSKRFSEIKIHYFIPARLATILSLVVFLASGAFAQSSPLFRPAVSYPSGGHYYATRVAVADVNGDKKSDLIVLNYCGAAYPSCGYSSIGILLGKGNGTFQPAITLALSASGVTDMAVGDVNGDGRVDLLVGYGGLVDVLLGNGDASFQPPVTTSCEGVISLATADMNADGKLDLVVTSRGLSVLLGNGDGTFQTASTFYGGIPYEDVAVSDLNGDGFPDIVINSDPCGDQDCSWAGFVLVFLGYGDGTLHDPQTYDSSNAYHPRAVAVADLNGDGHPDIVSVNQLSDIWDPASVGNIDVLIGKGDGTFQSVLRGLYTGGPSSLSVAIADFNHDGKPDLVVSDFYYNSIFVFLGNGDGTFQNALGFSTGGIYASSLAAANLNQDTVPDVVVANAYSLSGDHSGSATVLLNTTAPRDVTHVTLTSSLNPSTYGQPVTWTATVTTTGAFPPTGTVAFTWRKYVQSYTIGTATVNSHGVATFTRSSLNADSYPVTAVYRGDTNNLTSSSPVVNQVVQQASSKATITSSKNPSSPGQAVTFTAKVASPTVIPKGPVVFFSGKTVLGTVQLSGGQATLKTSSLMPGSNIVTVTFSGNSNIAQSSASVTQQVQP